MENAQTRIKAHDQGVHIKYHHAFEGLVIELRVASCASSLIYQVPDGSVVKASVSEIYNTVHDLEVMDRNPCKVDVRLQIRGNCFHITSPHYHRSAPQFQQDLIE